MRIVDAQVHIWAANTPERPWPARAEPHRAPLGKEELLAEMDKAGVDGVVIVPPSWEGDRNDVALDATASHPDRFCIMGRFDPDAPTSGKGAARDQIAGWRKQQGMMGMRFTFHTEVLRQPLLDGRFDWVWGEMEKVGIPAMVLFHHEYMHLADKVAERYPGLRLVLDHLNVAITSCIRCMPSLPGICTETVRSACAPCCQKSASSFSCSVWPASFSLAASSHASSEATAPSLSRT
jgi:predicted TIM-barrel fold metal-dependent hydrolase